MKISKILLSIFNFLFLTIPLSIWGLIKITGYKTNHCKPLITNSKFLVPLIILSLTLAVIASMIGCGPLQAVLIVMVFLSLIGFFANGFYNEGFNFWWGTFKDNYALPVAWILLHLGFILMFPNAGNVIWQVYWKYLMALEIFVITAAIILAVRRPFEQKPGRRILLAISSLMIFVALGMIYASLFEGEKKAEIDESIYLTLSDSRGTMKSVSIRIKNLNRKLEPLYEKQEKIEKIAAKRELTPEEIAEEIKTKRDIKELIKTAKAQIRVQIKNNVSNESATKESNLDLKDLNLNELDLDAELDNLDRQNNKPRQKRLRPRLEPEFVEGPPFVLQPGQEVNAITNIRTNQRVSIEQLQGKPNSYLLGYGKTPLITINSKRYTFRSLTSEKTVKLVNLSKEEEIKIDIKIN